MRVALAQRLDGIESVQLGRLRDPVPAAGQVLVEVKSAGVGPWDVGFVNGDFPGLTLPFVPGQEVAGVVSGLGEEVVGFEPGQRVYGSLFPGGGGFAELALVAAERLAAMPGQAGFEQAAGLVVAAGTAHEGLMDRGRLQAGQTLLITAAAGGVGGAAVQIAAAVGAHVLAVASAVNHDYVRTLGASDAVDYHDRDWVEHVKALVPDGVDLLFDAAGGRTHDQALDTVRDGGRATSIVLQGTLAEPGRGITSDSFAAHVDQQRLDSLTKLVDAGKLRPQTAAVLPLHDVREALARVARGHNRGKIVLEISP